MNDHVAAFDRWVIAWLTIMALILVSYRLKNIAIAIQGAHVDHESTKGDPCSDKHYPRK